MKTYHLAVIPGDGIGIEVMDEGLKVLKSLEKPFDLKFTTEHYAWGCEYYLKHGRMMDEDGLEKLKAYDAILLGAVGFPGVPDHISLRDLLLKIRQGFNQYINYRPVKLLDSQFCPLKNKEPRDIDMVFIRENREGEYAGAGAILNVGQEDEMALQTGVFTRKNTAKVMRYAFELARKRNRLGKLTSITKSNALNYSMVFWDRVFADVAQAYPEIQTNAFHVDAAAMFMVQKPEQFDVVVASNLFGDILTDLGAALQGGLGFAAAANINPEREYPSMFEPVHGSAPDIAGQGLANPIAMIWTIALMLEHLGENAAASCVLDAIAELIKDKERLTADMGGRATTSAVGLALCRLIENGKMRKSVC